MEKIKVVIATNNENKVKEIEYVLKNDRFEFLTLNQIGFNKKIIEDGSSFFENALIKAKEVYNFNNKYWIIADDSGLEVPYLKNDPGIFSARYSGDHDDKKNIYKLLKNLKNVEGENRKGRFVCAIACIVDANTYFLTEGEVWGIITKDLKGDSGFGYDPVMYYSPFNKTFAQMSIYEKNQISHRANALKKLQLKINDYLEEKR